MACNFQIGCFIPAESAQFRITDRIFSRIGFSDDMECNASTFIVEVKQLICGSKLTEE